MDFPLSSALVPRLEYLPETGSTNNDLLAKSADTSYTDLSVLVTDYQLAGRGRLDRSWEAPAGSSIMASILLRPKFQDQGGFAWLSLLAALAITEAANSVLGSNQAGLKWPNDVLVREKKLSGVLAQANEDLSSVVVGFGINVFQSPSELPHQGATSLSIEGSDIDRDQFLAQVLKAFALEYQLLKASGGDASSSGLREKVISASKTIGSRVSVSFPDQSQKLGLAVDIDELGRLVLEISGDRVAIAAADITHLRPQVGKN